MEHARNPIPFHLDDQPAFGSDIAPTFDDIGVKPIGHVVSPHGVELVAVDGDHQANTHHDMTSLGWLFHTYVTPPKATLRIDSGPEISMPRFIFLPPQTPVRWQSSPSLNAVCLFGQEFVSRLVETEPGLGFASLDCVITDETDHLAYLAEQILNEAISPGFGAGLLAEAIGLEIALEVVRCDRSQRPDEAPLRGGFASRQKRRLETYVHEHLSTDLSLQSLAAAFGVSARYMSRAVKQDKGVGLHRWIADLRLAEAQRLLAETGLPLHEIARRVAFKSPHALSKAFRAACGLSPSEYRRRATKL